MGRYENKNLQLQFNYQDLTMPNCWNLQRKSIFPIQIKIDVLDSIITKIIMEVLIMCQIAISIPDEVLFDTKMSREEANHFARCAVAVGYYTQSGVSIGYCAQIAGMTEEEFIKYLGQNHISVFKYDNKEEFLEELNNA